MTRQQKTPYGSTSPISSWIRGNSSLDSSLGYRCHDIDAIWWRQTSRSTVSSVCLMEFKHSDNLRSSIIRPSQILITHTLAKSIPNKINGGAFIICSTNPEAGATVYKISGPSINDVHELYKFKSEKELTKWLAEVV